jgi:ribokinase
VTVDVVVVGSVNRDVSVMTPRLPRPGESVTGTEHFYGPGGKGANQAVAAARLGASVAIVGRVGRDEHGPTLVSGMRAEGIDVSALGEDPENATGIAIITIDARAENTIVVSPGANMHLSADHVEQHRDLIEGARVVLAQLEVPTDTVLAAARMTSGLFCLNPAPAREIPDDLLEWVDVLIPNRSELASLAHVDEPGTRDETASAVRSLGRRAPTVVTLGSAGAILVDSDGVTAFPAPAVDPVDPTGAGDAFCGALACFLSQGTSLEKAVPWAVAAGAAAVTRRGAQSAMPTIEEVEALVVA